MKSSQELPWQRIVLAVALSALAHSLLLLQLPKIEWPAQDKTLPQLQAKLEPLPVLKKKVTPRKPVAKIAIPEKEKTEPVAAPTLDTTAASSEQAENKTTNLPLVPTPAPSHPRLPKHAQLHFAVQYHAGTFKLGEIVHTLNIEDDRYVLRAESQTTGLVSLFRSYQLTQTSTGSIDSKGFKPQRYTEAKTDRNGTQISSAVFNWDTHTISFSGAQENDLPEQSQDILSLPYQLSQLPLESGIIPMALSTGKKITQYYLSTGIEETISTVMGELRTISVSKMHGDNEDGLIIWLALEYRLLPVKILYLDKSGEVSANMVITDIRVSDE